MNFLPCPRGPGRPNKNIHQGAPSIPAAKQIKSPAIDCLTEESIFSATPAILRQYEVLPEPKKKQGRQAGSKNKQKETQQKPTQRELAENSSHKEVFYDEGDICIICEFSLNHPTKKNIIMTSCLSCLKAVHKPCLEKSDCNCKRSNTN